MKIFQKVRTKGQNIQIKAELRAGAVWCNNKYFQKQNKQNKK